ncbi:MAG: ABC transporter ATP-binding protein [Candidatus Hadarchaeia archaeon]
MGKTILEVKGLRGYYRGSFGVVQGVDGIDFTVEEGDRIAIAGESGCGKTTLIELLTGTPEPLLHHEGGKVIVEGYDIWNMDPEELRTEVKCKHLSYVPQSSLNALNPTQKLKEFTADMLTERRNENYSPKEARDMLGEHFERLGLNTSMLDRHPHELSGGERQRANIAISTFAEPSILLIDEPTSSLDVTSQKKMVELLVDIQRKGIIDSLLCVSHDLGVLRQLCDRLAVMYGGRLVEMGNMDDIINDSLHPYVQALISSLLPVEKDIKDKDLKSIPGTPPDLRNPPQGCRFHPRCQASMNVCREERPPEIDREGHTLTCWLYATEDQKEGS